MIIEYSAQVGTGLNDLMKGDRAEAVSDNSS